MLASYLTKQNIFYLSIASICCIAGIIQTQLPFNLDLSWDLVATKRLLAGGTYTKDFFDLNPPLIFYLLIPPVLITKYFNIPINLSFHFYTFCICLLSLGLSYYFLKNNKKTAYVFTSFLAIIYFILPCMDYGEREHFLILFSTPYILSIAYRLDHHTIPSKLALLIGLLAAFAFFLKPYFLLTPILLELYVMFSTKKFFSWLRIDTAVMAIFLVAYILFTYQFHHDFITNVLPVARRYYHKGISDPWSFVIINPWTLYCYLSLLLFIVYSRKKHNNTLINILFLALLSFLFAYFIQIKRWYYHIYPALSFALLLNTLIFLDYFKNHQIKAIILGAIIFSIPLFFLQNIIIEENKNNKLRVMLEKYLVETMKNKSIYIMTTSADYFLLSFYSEKLKYSSRFMHLFWLPAMTQINDDSISSELKEADNKQFIQWIGEDISEKNSDYIIVDNKDYKTYLFDKPIHIMKYLLSYPSFNKVMQNYEFIKSIRILEYDPNNADDWLLYYLPDISPDEKYTTLFPKNKNSVVFYGKGNSKKASFIRNEHWVKTKFKNPQPIVRHITLTANELNILNASYGYIKKNKVNRKIINNMINKSINNPFYQFDIYARKNLSENTS